VLVAAAVQPSVEPKEVVDLAVVEPLYIMVVVLRVRRTLVVAVVVHWGAVVQVSLLFAI